MRISRTVIHITISKLSRSVSVNTTCTCILLTILSWCGHNRKYKTYECTKTNKWI